MVSQSRHTTQIKELNNRVKREIARRKNAEYELILIKNKYENLFDNIPCIILILDNSGNIKFFNKYAQKVFGYPASELTGKNITMLTGVDPNFHKIFDESFPFFNFWDGEAWQASGQTLWIEWSVMRSDDAASTEEILCLGIDRTEKKSVEEQIIHRTEDMAITRERARLARELHDAVSQTIFSVSLIAEVIPLLWERDQEEARQRLKEIGQLTRGALAEMRTLLMELRPSSLAKANLSELIAQLALAVKSRSLIDIEVFTEQCSLPVDIKLALYRITQEALNNIVKHSKANLAKISLSSIAGKIELRISDNGQGFNMIETPNGSLGIRNMRERAEEIGAELEIKSQQGGGTDIILRFDKVLDEVSS
jgi:PAS domain S-box-containing protein